MDESGTGSSRIIAARLHHRGPFERAPPGEHLVHDEAERELVGAEVDRASRRLFRRHISDGPEDRSLERRSARQRCRRLSLRTRSFHRLDHGLPGQAEIEDLCASVGAEHDVLGFEVAVNDALGVRRRESLRDLARDRQDLPERQRSFGKRLPKRPPLDPFHGDPGDLARLSHVVNRHDRRMIQDRCCSCLDLKATPKGRIGEQPRRDHLQRGVASQARITCAVDLSHSSGPEERLDPVRTEEVGSSDMRECECRRAP